MNFLTFLIFSLSWTKGLYFAKLSEQPVGAVENRRDYFHAAREALLAGDFENSHKNISQITDGGITSLLFNKRSY